jgi:ferric-dicitrate binding protein FerR (iron transport regulator)
MTCGREWQAEALEDGRLSDGDRASFERHAANCADCAAERDALADLRERMAVVDAERPSELARRGLRQEILRRAHLVADARPRARFAIGAVAVAAAVAALWVGVGHRGPAAPAYEVVDVAHASVRVEDDGPSTRVALDTGTALFAVKKLEPGRRFVVRLPDGELEVRGTRFVVEVAGGRTRSVAVTEGRVALRLGGGEIVLGAGDRWPPAVAEGAPAAASVATVAAAPSLPADTAVPAIAPSARPVDAMALSSAAPQDPPRPSAAASASAAPVDADSASARFAEAMGAFSSGGYARADALFAAFVQRFPRDGRSEDASYLRVECHARTGDSAGAAALARQYLAAYPRGLRRPEVERFAGGP